MVKKKSQKSLTKWTKQKWDYISKADKKKPKSKRGRYLPASVRAKMTPAQKKIAGMTPPFNKITGSDFKAMRKKGNK